MEAVIPAAGRGSRLGALTDDQPKGLVEIAGQPLLAHVFDRAIEAGADELVVIIGYEGAQIVDRFGETFRETPITYVHQRERLGLAHAVLQAEPCVSDAFLVEEVPWEEASRYDVCDTTSAARSPTSSRSPRIRRATS